MKAIIVDDERLARRELISLLKEHPEIQVVGECANVEEAKSKISSLGPDVIFLDIEMPEQSGFDLLNELEGAPQIVFVTAYEDYALKAFDVNAFDYLTKPVLPNRLKETVQKLLKENDELKELSSKKGTLLLTDKIFIKDGEKCWFVNMKDIILFKSEGNYVRILFKDDKPLVLMSLNSLENRLDDSAFFRANRKYIINLQWVDRIENWFNGGLKLTLLNGENIEISRRQAVKFKIKFGF